MMTNDELNKFILRYVENDRTHRALMLSGGWGTGKSYYVNHFLVPFLESRICPATNKPYKCIVVSLYGLNSPEEISRDIFLMRYFGNHKRPDKPVGNAVRLAARTIMKGLSMTYKIPLPELPSFLAALDPSVNGTISEKTVSPKALQDLYESADLEGCFVILEDVERSGVNVLSVLSYVNNLTEQDHNRVMLVTNEDDLIRLESPAPAKAQADGDDPAAPVKPVYTKETLLYLRTKEKSICDTVYFQTNIVNAVGSILTGFPELAALPNAEVAQKSYEIMTNLQCYNMRSFIAACQKMADIVVLLPYMIETDFLKTCFYGVLNFLLRVNAGEQIAWDGFEHYSFELGSADYPLFRFCYDFIMDHSFTEEEAEEGRRHFGILLSYDRNGLSGDPELAYLYKFERYPEKTVRGAVADIVRWLSEKGARAVPEYGRLAVQLLMIKSVLCDGKDPLADERMTNHIEEAKRIMLKNLRAAGNGVDADSVFRYVVPGQLRGAEKKEYEALRAEMLTALRRQDSFVPGFYYEKTQVPDFCRYVKNNQTLFDQRRGFAKDMDAKRFAKLFVSCDPALMDEIRAAFYSLYRVLDASRRFPSDLPVLEKLLTELETERAAKEAAGAPLDRIQQLQYDRFVEKLRQICGKLR